MAGTTTRLPGPTRTSSCFGAWSRSFPWILLFLFWIGFVVWQYGEHRRQCDLIHQTLTSQAEALSNAVAGSLQSHRWFGPFVQQQLPLTLEVLANADNVMAIVVLVNNDFERPYSAGDVTQVDASRSDGEHVIGETLHFIRSFEKQAASPPNARWTPEVGGRPSVEDFRTIVVLDRSRALAQVHRELVNRILMVVFGTLLLAAVGIGWWFSVRLARMEGQARLLTAEARHLRELGQAAAGLAHETRNPLGLIRGWTQRLLEAGLPKEDQRRQAEAVLEECDRVTARINQFLYFARPVELQLQAVPLGKLLEELATLLQSDFDERRLTVAAVPGGEEWVIQADRSLLRQLLFNLLQNAISFAPPGSAITITTKTSQAGRVRLEIADEGPGVPAAIVASLFEPYVTRRPGGTGLGLSIVRRIADSHEWEVGYRPKPGHGSVFWIDGIRVA